MKHVSGSRWRPHTLFILIGLVLLTGVLLPAGAATMEERMAILESAAKAGSSISAGDNAWLLVSSALVLMMTAPGLILFYGGLVRSKNVLSTMMHSLILMGVVSLLWMVYGYSMAFGEGNAFFGNPFQYFMLHGVGLEPNPDYAGTDSAAELHAVSNDVRHHHSRADQRRHRGAHEVQRLFAVHGAVGDDRLFSVVPHGVGQGRLFNWASGGKPSRAGFRRRHGGAYQFRRFGARLRDGVGQARWDFRMEPMMPHNVVLSLIGTGLLWVGWFGFNAGSALGAGALATSAFAATHFSAAAAALGWAGMEWLLKGKPSVLGAASGMVAGLATITPASGFVTIPAALLHWIDRGRCLLSGGDQTEKCVALR